MKSLIPAVLLFAFELISVPAKAQFGGPVPVIDATSIAKELEILRANVLQLQAALQNLKGMAGGSAWSNQAGYLDELGQLIASGNGLSYQLQNLQQQFTSTFPG